MKRTIAAITLATLAAACTDAELINMAHGQCDQIGYAKGSQEYTECVERGFRGSKTAQDGAIAGTTGAIIAGAIIGALY